MSERDKRKEDILEKKAKMDEDALLKAFQDRGIQILESGNCLFSQLFLQNLFYLNSRTLKFWTLQIWIVGKPELIGKEIQELRDDNFKHVYFAVQNRIIDTGLIGLTTDWNGATYFIELVIVMLAQRSLELRMEHLLQLYTPDKLPEKPSWVLAMLNAFQRIVKYNYISPHYHTNQQKNFQHW